MKWAAVTAVESAPDGSIFVVHRCFASSCAGRPEPPILKYDANGRLLNAFGEGLRPRRIQRVVRRQILERHVRR
jgi:hypothetical protein